MTPSFSWIPAAGGHAVRRRFSFLRIKAGDIHGNTTQALGGLLS
jgi:hypothetical protein